MKTSLIRILSAAAVAISLVSGVEIEIQPELCTVRAWVRAEDLSPDHVSRGELRIKVPRAECANQIASVSLRLQLDEFGEFKYLNKGAVLPDVRPTNESASPTWMGSDVVYDYTAHDAGLSDPTLWAVKAEERRTWTTEAILLDNNPKLSEPIVTPFHVAVPAVDYPPVDDRHRTLWGPFSRHAWGHVGYRYIAVVTFIDGRTEDVLAGHTTFVPSSQASVQQTPFMWSTSFEELNCGSYAAVNQRHSEKLQQCLPEARRSAFDAEITFEEGNVVQKGQRFKGRLVVNSIKEGSTAMLDVSVHFETRQQHHWAQAQAAAGGDAEFHNVTSGNRMCETSGGGRALSPESDIFAFLFDEEKDTRPRNGRWALLSLPVSPAHPYIDFELQVPYETPVDFTSYYSNVEHSLYFRLTVLYSPEVAECMKPGSLDLVEGEATDGSDEANTEEGLWDTYTRIGKPVESAKWRRSMALVASVPITVVGDAPPAPAVTHYLTPGVAAPVLRRGAQPEMPPSFPVVQPVFTVEALVNTSARLMLPGSTDPAYHMRQFTDDYPDPTRDYRRGSYAGLLWKKKVVAEERAISPLGLQVGDGGDGQKPLSMRPQ